MIVGPSYNLDVREADVQRTINMIPVVSDVAGSKQVAYLDSVPGLATFSLATIGYLLQEDGAYLLLESGGRIKL